VSTASPFLVKFRHSWTEVGAGQGAVVVAVSGGPDSLALLRALLTLAASPVVVAHLNHLLRGEESDADEAFVREVHRALVAAGRPSLVLRCERLDVAAAARAEGDNLENAARRLRYGWLASVARESGARWVATGHTADDQAETVLHRLLRGTGLKGLCGIPGRRELAPGVELVRPLLAVTRAEVVAFLAEEGQSFRDDRSNSDLRFTRNRLRHELLPHLAEHYNPAVGSVLCRLTRQAGEVYADLETQAHALLAAVELPRTRTGLVFDRQKLAAAPRFLVREALRLAWEREEWAEGEMTSEDWDRAAAVAFGETAAVDLPGGFRACGRERSLLLGW
jgi:tRNA(Ile)-lysidine synthase